MSETPYEAMQYREPDLRPGLRYTGPEETTLGTFASEADAIEVARAAWHRFRDESPDGVAWWIVRKPGEELARWIADSRHDVERVLDLTTNELVEVPR